MEFFTTFFLGFLHFFHLEDETNNRRSSINTEQCELSNYPLEQNCFITNYLEQNEIKGSRYSGVNFCTYKILHEEKQTEKISFLYLSPVCEEYFVVDFVLSCENEEKKYACLDTGLDGSVQNIAEKNENIDWYARNVKKNCDDSCHYAEEKFLSTGEGSAGGTVILTFDSSKSTIENFWSPNFSPEYNSIPEEYKKGNVQYQKKYDEYYQTGNLHKGGVLMEQNKKRAEDFFGLPFRER